MADISRHCNYYANGSTCKNAHCRFAHDPVVRAAAPSAAASGQAIAAREALLMGEWIHVAAELEAAGGIAIANPALAACNLEFRRLTAEVTAAGKRAEANWALAAVLSPL
ncbi:hypothetical protein B0H66DRAFT_606073 [Apodospora peruviana]|uniref:C3H1-type domain-containing protein n=1 Tax=Apodospora peruviana TaxID=516989 RepID=A0AAE0M156_9PEZI|nr:hypothetical protein B0H66DRAFT_606073 [Apodospora peruviana]